MANVPERPGAEFRPYVPAGEAPAEFTPKAIILGMVFGVLFGAATVYLALRAGLTVSASVPIAGAPCVTLARMVFAGVGASLLYKFLYGILGLWRETPIFFRTKKESATYPAATLDVAVTPEYLGLGYIIGPRISSELFSGGLLAWMALIPLIAIFVPETRVVQDLHNLGFSDAWMANNSYANWLYRAYIRYIGAGAVACAGVMTLIKTLPTIVSAFRESVKSFRGGVGPASGVQRTERDLGMGIVVIGSLAIVLVLAILPGFPHGPFPGSLLMSLLIVVFGFFFVTVSSRIVGIIGTSSNPISGMTIATLMATCIVFVVIGWRGRSEEHTSEFQSP